MSAGAKFRTALRAERQAKGIHKPKHKVVKFGRKPIPDAVINPVKALRERHSIAEINANHRAQ